MYACEGCSKTRKEVELIELDCLHAICQNCIRLQREFLPKVHHQGYFVCMNCGRRHESKDCEGTNEDRQDSYSVSDKAYNSEHGRMFSIEINTYLKQSSNKSIDLFEEEQSLALDHTSPKESSRFLTRKPRYDEQIRLTLGEK